MIQEITKTLKEWAQDDRIAFVVIEGTGDKAFCAGGDIRSVYLARLEENMTEKEQESLSSKQGGRPYMDAIFREEYQMNYLISQYPKPYIALIQGICMGGGLGLSVHGSHRIITDDTVMAMPESAIGYFTDIGASYFLNKVPGKIGVLMGITGARLNVGDCLYSGLGTHYVPKDQWDHLRETLLKAPTAEDARFTIENFSLVGIPSELSALQEDIDALFGAPTLPEVLKNLENSKLPKAYEWLKETDTKSPTRMQITFSLLQKGMRYSLKKCLTLEFRLSQRFVENYDFFEGVRTVLIDKNSKAHWQPSRLDDVKPARIKYYFAPLVRRPELNLKEWNEL